MDRKSVSVTVLSDTDQQIRLKLPCAIKSYEIDGERQEKEQLPEKDRLRKA